MKNSKTSPQIKVTGGAAVQDTSLLDQLMMRNREMLAHQGIELPGLTKDEKLQHWSQADGLYETIGRNILNIGEEVAGTARAIAAVGINEVELNLAVRSIMNDLVKFGDDLKTIQNRHEDMKGPVCNPAQHTLYLSVGQDYMYLAEQLKANIFANMLTVQEYSGKAMLKIQTAMQEQQLSPEQDPNVITDVEVKETKDVQAHDVHVETSDIKH